MRPLPACLAALLALGCGARHVSTSSLERVDRPAFVARIEEKAGPRSRVFTADDTYRERLGALAPAEADRRLAERLAGALSRFELSERLRVHTLARLPQAPPWTRAVDPARVASTFQSFLVEEVPAGSPDYTLLRPLGADAVVELALQEYGLRSEEGRAGVYVRGVGRLFLLDGGRELWHQPFERDGREAARVVDPFQVAQDPSLYREALVELLDTVAAQLAAGLTPPQRR